MGDNRIPACVPQYADGTEAADLRYAGYAIHPGKYALPGLPAFRASERAQSLCVTLRDAGGLSVELWYAVYDDCDVITRTAVFGNTGARPLVLRQAASLCLDFPGVPLDWITLDGVWAGERTPTRAPLRPGEQTVGSTKGIPGHGHSPAAILCTPDADETHGECWAAAFVYSGSFEISAERCEAGARLVCGIHPYHFAWALAPGASFAAPETALVYSDAGLGEMSRRFHRAIRAHLLPPAWAGGARFDCGMLYYSPQIWCSDNTDACARTNIQYGTSLIYPYETMGAHFSTVPNHCTGHVASPEARMALALSGTFGFELDLTKYSAGQLAELTPHIEWYRAHGAMLRAGELYRLLLPDSQGTGAAWCIVSPDAGEAAVFCVGAALAGRGERCPRLVLRGLDEAAVYEDEDGARWTGFLLQTLGLPLPGTFGQMPAARWYLRRVAPDAAR